MCVTVGGPAPHHACSLSGTDKEKVHDHGYEPTVAIDVGK